MPLMIYAGRGSAWHHIGTLGPKDQPGSIADNKSPRQVYVFKCGSGDTHSRLLRSKVGIDIEHLNLREVNTVGFEVVTILRKGESHELGITTMEGASGKIKFMHV